ncbi:MAG: acyltransferase family protein [Bacilli bacterium]|nr:acyltransferase family protein [Bacilli bacterium]
MKNNRLLYIDILKSIAILFVIIIHTTSNYMMQVYGTGSFKIFLALNTVISIAVPLFFMLSGASLIRNNSDIDKKNTKRIVKRVYQLFFWTFIYLTFEKYYFGSEINIFNNLIKSIFKYQVSHLWFMYPLLALYILTPIVSKLYYSLNEKKINYLLIFTFIIPLFIKCFIQYFDFVSIPIFSVGFSEFGYFILGKYIYDKKDYLLQRTQKKFWTILTIISISFVIIYAKIDHYYFGFSDKPYFDYSRFPVALYCISFYTLFMLLEDKFNKISKKILKVVTNLGSNTGGIYYIHMLYIYILSNLYVLGIGFTANNGNIIFMLLGALLYLGLSWGTIVILKRIPYVKELIN